MSKVKSKATATRHFIWQRMSALALVPLTLFILYILALVLAKPYGAALELITNPFIGAALVIFIIAAAIHMRLGAQVIIEDYIHAPLLHRLAIILNNITASAIALVAIASILRIILGVAQ